MLSSCPTQFVDCFPLTADPWKACLCNPADVRNSSFLASCGSRGLGSCWSPSQNDSVKCLRIGPVSKQTFSISDGGKTNSLVHDAYLFNKPHMQHVTPFLYIYSQKGWKHVKWKDLTCAFSAISTKCSSQYACASGSIPAPSMLSWSKDWALSLSLWTVCTCLFTRDLLWCGTSDCIICIEGQTVPWSSEQCTAATCRTCQLVPLSCSLFGNNSLFNFSVMIQHLLILAFSILRFSNLSSYV